MGIRPARDPDARFSRGDEAERILGVDPGTLHTGWGLVEVSGGSLHYLAHGTIGSPRNKDQGSRLRCIYRGLKEVLCRYEPQGISLEKIFFSRNAQSALKLGQARGVAILAAAESGIDVHEYSSTEIKLAVVGYGHASKLQVMKMVASLLHPSSRVSADAADALAAAICHLHQWSYHARVVAALPSTGQERRRWGTS
jgi:crossover junction endodeoxyribonuclease RuvC